MAPRVLSHQIEAIEYIHADDGLPYRHDFTRGDSEIDLRKDGSVLIRNTSKQDLWDTFTVDGRPQPFLVNPRGVRDKPVRRSAMKRKKKSNFGKRMAALRRRSNAPRRAKAVRPVKRRRRRSAVARSANPPARRRRHRRNPPSFSGRGIIQSLTQGVVDATWTLAGKIGVQLVSAQFPFDDGSMTDTAVEVGTAIVMGLVLPRFIGADRTRFVMAGGFLSPLETLVKQAKIPHVSNLLSGLPISDTRMTFPSGDSAGMLGAYPEGAPRLGAYVQGGGADTSFASTYLQS